MGSRFERRVASRRAGRLSVALAGLGLALAVQAQPAAPDKAAFPEVQGREPVAAPPDSARPRLGLVLSGGGARGFAHIGVIKVLEELGIEVEVITATSMGSIVGGGYAAGYTAAEMQKIVAEVDWAAIFAGRAPRAELDWRRKEDDFRNLAAGEIGISGGKPALPAGALSAQNLDIFLRTLTRPVGNLADLERLPVPFAAMATNLETGKLVVMQKGATLEQAMRASMSVPGAFPPIDYRGQLLVDGGLVRNLPVDAARQMGAQRVIAVNVGTPLSGRESLGTLIGVAGQMINILTEQNVHASLAQLHPDDILITPDLSAFSAADFSRWPAIIAAGEAAARAAIERLRPLASSPEQYARWQALREAAIGQSTPYVFKDVKVEGLTTVNPAAVLAEADLPLGQPVDGEQVAAVAQRVWGSDDFTSVSYRIEPAPGGGQSLVLLPVEKPWGYSALRLGGSVQTDFADSHSFNFLIAHTWSWVNRWGAEWRNELQVGESGLALSEFYQPLGPGSGWFVMPRVHSTRNAFDVYVGDDAVARFRNETLTGELRLGYQIGRIGVLSAGAGYARVSTRRIVGDPVIASVRSQAPAYSADLKLDTLDDINFPSRGYYLRASGVFYGEQLGATRGDTAYYGEATKPFTFGRWTTVLDARVGSSTQAGAFQLGGIFNLSGSPIGRFAGARLLFGRAMISRNVSDALGDIRMPIRAGVSLEAGRADASGRSVFIGNEGWQKAGSLFLGADSPIGPMYFALGHTFGGSSAIYLYWGRPQ